MDLNKSLIVIFFLLFQVITVSSQIKWSFETNTPLISNDLKTLNIHSVKKTPEITKGLTGNGLRTDGYSTWYYADFKEPLSITGISGWFALESFPVDTAAFLGIKNNKNQSVTFCVNRFGKIIIGLGEGEVYKYEPTFFYVDKFKWIHVLISTENEYLNFYIDGKKIIPNNAINNSFDDITEIIIAKDFRTKKLGIHDLTAINGLIDELSVWTSPVDFEFINKEIEYAENNIPKLAIPESRFVNDFSRPKYHLLPAANWTNETHSFIFYNNKYHIFNQKNASNMFLGQINWGHFSSSDLINWTEHKPALTPEEGYDFNGNWSGHAVINDDGIPTIIYTTGGEKMGTGIAFPIDNELVEWRKYEANPVIYGQPEGFTRTDPRDQFVWKENDTWYMIIGFGIEDVGENRGAVLLYKSKDLKNWDFIQTMFEGNPKVDNSGIFWEMPIFVKTDNKYILLVNKIPQKGIPARALYWTGDFKNEKFLPDNPKPYNLEIINRLLSPSVIIDKDGRITTMAIIPDEIGAIAAYQHGWAHLYSIPRVWQLIDGKIHQTPHPALEKLRGKHIRIENQKIKSGSALLLSKGHQLEIKTKIKPGKSTKYGFVLYKNEDNSEYTRIYYDAKQHEIVVDQTKSSLKEHIPLNTKKDSYKMENGKEVDFHLFIDGSALEIFVNGKDAFTTRVFPLHKESNLVEVFSEGADISIEADIWEINNAIMKTDY